MRISDLDIWRTFYFVARERSFALAAAKLRISPSLATKRVAHLETTLGIRLLNRTTRSVSLTQDGEHAWNDLESLLDGFENLESKFEKKSELRGKIRITSLGNLAQHLLAPLIKSFCDLYPAVHFEVLLNDQIIDLVSRRGVVSK